MEVGYSGQQGPCTPGSEFNALHFMVTAILSKVRTAGLVEVVAVDAGSIGPVGFVDVRPIVSQLDGAKNAVQHGVIYQLPYFRVQGGTNAVIIDPQVGDIGAAVFCDRDISAAKQARGPALPGSQRHHDMSDGLYFGGLLNGTPAQYVHFSSSGVEIVSPTKVTVQAPVVEVDATTSATVTSPSISLGNTGQTMRGIATQLFTDLYNSHTHPTGSPNTGVPNQQATSTHLTSSVKAA